MLDTAQMITAGHDREAAVLLGRTVQLDQPASAITSAVLSATAHGVYEATIDGQPGHRLRPQSGLDRLRVAAPRAAVRRHRSC